MLRYLPVSFFSADWEKDTILWKPTAWKPMNTDVNSKIIGMLTNNIEENTNLDDIISVNHIVLPIWLEQSLNYRFSHERYLMR